jgi:subtilisin family serine protease
MTVAGLERWKWLVLLLVALAVGPVAGQNVRSDDLEKAPANIVEAAKRGESQDLFVTLDWRDIEAREASKRASRGLRANDDAINGETLAEMDNLKAQVFPGGRLGGAVVIGDRRHVPILEVRVPNWESLARILSHPKVISVRGNDRMVSTLSQSLPLVGQPTAIAAGWTGTGYRIAVIDTGVDYRSSVFSSSSNGCRFNLPSTSSFYYPTGDYIGGSGCRISNAIDARNNPATVDYSFWDRAAGAGGFAHGSTITAIAARVAPGVKIDAISAADLSGALYQSYIFNGLDWILSHYSGGAGNIVAVNLSIGSNTTFTGECSSSPYAAYFSRLRSNGIIPVVASGNNGAKSGLAEPACAPGALRVGSVYDSDFSADQRWPLDAGTTCTDRAPRVDQVVCSSNSNSLLHLLAPGAYIQATDYWGGAGTSMAAPHVTGGVAILKQAFPTDSIDTTIGRMEATGKTVTDPGNHIAKPRLGLSAALQSATVGGGGGSGVAVAAVTAAAALTLVLN